MKAFAIAGILVALPMGVFGVAAGASEMRTTIELAQQGAGPGADTGTGPVYGSQLMTRQEMQQYRERMRNAKTAEERERVRAQHHAEMQRGRASVASPCRTSRPQIAVRAWGVARAAVWVAWAAAWGAVAEYIPRGRPRAGATDEASESRGRGTVRFCQPRTRYRHRHEPRAQGWRGGCA